MAGRIPGNQSAIPDIALIQGMAAGDPSALDQLYARYGSAVFCFLLARLDERQLAEEVVQDVMLAAWRSAGRFRGESKVLTWLLTIARNRAINARRRRALSVIPLHDELDARDGEAGPLERVVRQAEHRAVRRVLNQLPAQQREVLVLVFYHQLSMAEVAETLGIAVGTVKSRLHRGKETLRRVLLREGVL